jgi:hypothetical protein
MSGNQHDDYLVNNFLFGNMVIFWDILQTNSLTMLLGTFFKAENSFLFS